MVSIEQEDGLRSALDQAFNALHAIKGTVATMERERLQGRSDSPTDARNIGSAGLLRIVLQRTIEGEILDEDCYKVVEVLHKALHGDPKPIRPKTGTLPEEGYYRFEGDFVKVQISQSSGKPYAKMWLGDADTKQGRWEYQGGLYFKLRGAIPLSAEDAKQFGDLYGHCVFCGLELSDERSIAAGYGPTCADNRGLPWG